MNDNGSEQNVDPAQAGKADRCGPGCNCDCGTTSSGNKWKTIVCLLIVVAAAVVVVRGFARNAESKASQEKGSFTTAVPIPKGTTQKVNALLWGKPLDGLASLNEVATEQTAAFVYLAEKGREPSESVKRNIERAVGKSKSKGMAVSFYTLDDSSEDYAQITSQLPAPCVLAVVKGGGMSVVSGDISEAKLLQAMVTASRPSSCGPSGCGPSQDGTNSKDCGPSAPGCKP